MIYTMDAGGQPGYELRFYAAVSGACPVQELLDAMPLKHHGFLKKTQRTPPDEISRAERCMDDWLRRNES